MRCHWREHFLPRASGLTLSVPGALWARSFLGGLEGTGLQPGTSHFPVSQPCRREGTATSLWGQVAAGSLIALPTHWEAPVHGKFGGGGCLDQLSRRAPALPGPNPSDQGHPQHSLPCSSWLSFRVSIATPRNDSFRGKVHRISCA